MLYDFMRQIISRLDGIENKVDANQQNLERIVRKIEKRKVNTTVLLCGLHASLNGLLFAGRLVRRWSHEQPTYTIMQFLYDDNCVNIANFQLGNGTWKNSNGQHVKIVKWGINLSPEWETIPMIITFWTPGMHLIHQATLSRWPEYSLFYLNWMSCFQGTLTM